jgi:flavin reductase (DIM6/NTAB) family NADH-FMN oxidoreductase RutF
VALSTKEFDAFVAGLDYPMFVVTTAHDGERAGCLVGFTTQVSLHPPRLLEDCPRRMVGRVLLRQEYGDHVGYLLEPLSMHGTGATAALGFEQAEDTDAGHPA